MTVAEYIANQLSVTGIKYVFGIPGGPSIPYMEAFKAVGIEFILTSNESTAAIMADVTARLTGIPGICHATFGPGATNISTGVGGALLDRSPVIVFTSEINDLMLSRTTQMNIDHQKLFGPVTKATFRAGPGNIRQIIDRALKLCLEEYPGPVHIGLPSDIAGMHVPENIFTGYSNEIMHFPGSNNIEKIQLMLEGSRSPLMAIGLTAARLGLSPQILEFLEEHKMPVVLTPMAKGIIPENHPCYAGVLFHSLSDYLEDIYERCDLVIGIGYDPVEFDYESWLPDVPLLHFDIVEMDLPSTGRTERFTGSPDDWFEMLGYLNRGSLHFDRIRLEGIRNEMASVFEGFTNHFGPVSVLKILKSELPENAIITADVGSHLHLLGQFWEAGHPGNMIMTNGWSGMGFGLPAALAVQLNEKGKTVVCITGDGGFLMMAGEVVTAVRYNLPVIIVVLSDGELNLIKLKQSWKDLPPYGTQLYQGDLFASEMFFGVRVLTADSAESMKKSINEALFLSEPVIINAIIDPDDYKWLIVKR